jgi:hypothetical protein
MSHAIVAKIGARREVVGPVSLLTISCGIASSGLPVTRADIGSGVVGVTVAIGAIRVTTAVIAVSVVAVGVIVIGVVAVPVIATVIIR